LGTCSALLVGAVSSTTQIAGNSFGTNDFTVTTAQSTAGLIAQNTGNAGYNATASFLAPNVTAGNRATIDLGHDIGTGNYIQEEFSWTGANNGSNYWGISMGGVGTDFIHWQYFPDVLTLGDTGSAITMSGVTTFPASGIKLTGSSTGVTTLASANASATNYTATLPANTGTVPELNLAQTWTATQTFAGITSSGINASPIGATTPSTGSFTTLAASSTVSGTGFSTYLASPPAIGGTTAAAGTFTALRGNTSITTGGAFIRNVRTVTASGAITGTATDDVICVNKTTGAASAVSLEATPVTGHRVTVKDCKGDANTNNITITPNAGNIDGSANFVINTNYGSWTGWYSGAAWETESSR